MYKPILIEISYQQAYDVLYCSCPSWYSRV